MNLIYTNKLYKTFTFSDIREFNKFSLPETTPNKITIDLLDVKNVLSLLETVSNIYDLEIYVVKNISLKTKYENELQQYKVTYNKFIDLHKILYDNENIEYIFN